MRSIALGSHPHHKTSKFLRYYYSKPLHNSWSHQSTGLIHVGREMALSTKRGNNYQVKEHSTCLRRISFGQWDKDSLRRKAVLRYNIHIRGRGCADVAVKRKSKNSYRCAILLYVSIIIIISARFFFAAITAFQCTVAVPVVESVCGKWTLDVQYEILLTDIFIKEATHQGTFSRLRGKGSLRQLTVYPNR
jgi:hypothetical protein